MWPTYHTPTRLLHACMRQGWSGCAGRQGAYRMHGHGFAVQGGPCYKRRSWRKVPCVGGIDQGLLMRCWLQVGVQGIGAMLAEWLPRASLQCASPLHSILASLNESRAVVERSLVLPERC